MAIVIILVLISYAAALIINAVRFKPAESVQHGQNNHPGDDRPANASKTSESKSVQASKTPTAKGVLPAKAIGADIDEMEAAKNLSEMIKCKTVSNYDKSKIDYAEFDKFVKILPELFPSVYKNLELETGDDYSLLFCWKGKKPGRPVVLMAHYDVVPAEGNWTVPPFSGQISDGIVHGRGAIDTKITMLGVLQASEILLRGGFEPDYDIYLAFCADEEVGGCSAQARVRKFKEKGLNPRFVLDEGGMIMPNMFPGVAQPAAMIGIAEKGMANFELSITSAGGHASVPARTGPAEALALAVSAIHKHPFKPALTAAPESMLMTLARYSTFGYRILFGNMWCFRWLIKYILPRINRDFNALLRTTTAVTELSGSKAHNVIPTRASATVNVRLTDRQTIDIVGSHFSKLTEKYGVKVNFIHGENASPCADPDSEGYALVSEAIKSAYGDVLISPYVMLGATDSRYYCEISDCVLRFSPIMLTAESRATVHAANEHISVKNIAGCVRFYVHVIQNIGKQENRQ